jgi:RHS repeat-associated protein
VDASTGEVIETRYKPWGEVRYATPNKTLPTRYTFMGQYSYISDDATDLGNAGFGLMFYNARWYDPYLNRYTQPDSIVPSGVQGLDRYAYTANNPVVYIDPSGHYQEGVCRGRSDYRCRIQARNMSAEDTLTPEQIMQLLGFETTDELDAWKSAGDANLNFYNLLRLSHMGDIVRLNWAGETFNLMIVPIGSVNGPLGFYDTDDRNLESDSNMQNFTDRSANGLFGATLLRDADGNKTYSWTGFGFGSVDTSNYTLQIGWNRDRNGKGGIVSVLQPSSGDFWDLAGGTAALLVPLFTPAAPVALIVDGIAVFGGIAIYGSTFSGMQSVYVYYPNLPSR